MTIQKLGAFLHHLSVLGVAGFPWIPGGHSNAAKCRAAGRQRLLRAWPRFMRPAAWVANTLLWPIRAAFASVEGARFLTEEARNREGTGRLASRAWTAAMRASIPPAEFFAYGLHRAGSTRDWLFGSETAALNIDLTSLEARQLCQDKRLLIGFAQARGLPVPKHADYGELTEGSIRGVVIKPAAGAQGRGIEIWLLRDGSYQREAEPRRRQTAASLSPKGFANHLRTLSARSNAEVLFEELVEPHAHLTILGPAPPVMRIVTGRARSEEPMVLDALLQRPTQGSYLSHGGPFRLIDTATGRLLPRPRPAPFPALRDDPAFEHLSIPDWHPLCQALTKAHRTVPGPAPLIGWDVIPGENGHVVLEANIALSPYFFQCASGCPVMWSEILASYLP